MSTPKSKSTKQKRERLILDLGSSLHAHSTKPTTQDSAYVHAKRLISLATTYTVLQEKNCNGADHLHGESAEYFAKRQFAFEELVARSEKLSEAKIRAIAEKFGADVCFDGDPRGYTVTLLFGEGPLQVVVPIPESD